jgi:hypothetical protein
MVEAGNSVASQIRTLQEYYAAVLLEEASAAAAHRNDPYFTNSRGHNVGQDEILAIVYAREINLKPTEDESSNAGTYACRILRDLEKLKEKYRLNEVDPDGYGIATLHSISSKLLLFSDQNFKMRPAE